MNLRFSRPALALVLGLPFAIAAAGCRGSEPPAPANAPSTTPADAGTSTTSGVIDEPNSPGMTNSGTPNPPGRGDPPQVLPPELTPNR
jgi:hypothetical protein